MHQPLFGALFPFLIAAILYFRRNGRASLPMLVVTPTTMLIAGIWAVVPDFPKLVGNMDLYYRMHANPWSNLFFLHLYIDSIETAYLDHLTPLFNTLFVCIVLMLLLAAWRELLWLERTPRPECQPATN